MKKPGKKTRRLFLREIHMAVLELRPKKKTKLKSKKNNKVEGRVER